MSIFTEAIHAKIVEHTTAEDIVVSAAWLDEETGHDAFLADLGLPPNEEHDALVFYGLPDGPYNTEAAGTWSNRTCAWGRSTEVRGNTVDHYISPKRARKINRSGGVDVRRSIRPMITTDGLE